MPTKTTEAWHLLDTTDCVPINAALLKDPARVRVVEPPRVGERAEIWVLDVAP